MKRSSSKQIQNAALAIVNSEALLAESWIDYVAAAIESFLNPSDSELYESGLIAKEVYEESRLFHQWAIADLWAARN